MCPQSFIHSFFTSFCSSCRSCTSSSSTLRNACFPLRLHLTRKSVHAAGSAGAGAARRVSGASTVFPRASKHRSGSGEAFEEGRRLWMRSTSRSSSGTMSRLPHTGACLSSSALRHRLHLDHLLREVGARGRRLHSVLGLLLGQSVEPESGHRQGWRVCFAPFLCTALVLKVVLVYSYVNSLTERKHSLM